MQKVFFYFTIFQEGHFAYPMPVVKSLIDVGHRVYAFHYPEYQPQLERIGAIFCPMPENESLKERLKHNQKTDFHPLVAALLTEAEQFLDGYFSDPNRIRPDAIIIESFSLAGALLAKVLAVPLIVNYFMLLDAKHAEEIGQDNPLSLDEQQLSVTFQQQIANSLVRLQRQYGIEKLKFQSPNTMLLDNADVLNCPTLNLVSVPETFFPTVRYDKTNCHFIGATKIVLKPPRLAQYPWATELGSKKILYVSLGSRYENPQLYHNILVALTELDIINDYLVILSLGRLYRGLKAQLIAQAKPYPNVHICDYVPQEELLEYTDLFITHGGMNSLREAVLRRVNCLFIPQGVDQFIVARRMHDMSVGIYLPGVTPSAGAVADALLAMRADSEHFQRQTAALATAFEQGGGGDRAVSLVESFLAAKAVNP